MITEDYVSFEVAKLLKEKGFDENTPVSYFVGDDKPRGCAVGEIIYHKRLEEDTHLIAMPTLQMAMKWLRDVHKKVINVKQIDDTYGYKLDDGSYFSGSFEKEYRLWSIEDAEKGDILQANKCTLIFDSLTKDIDGNTVISSWYHCNTKAFYGMGQSEPDLWDIEGIIPATKEQCYFLFQKMKEAGYVWDANKKELKKINDETNQ